MKTYPSATLRAFGLGLLLLCCCSLPLRAQQFGLFRYVVNGGTIEVTGYPKDATGPVEIPTEIAGKPVTSIGDGAFAGCTGLISVTIPHSVTSIGRHAFSACTSLTSITIPNSVTSIGDYAFVGCSRLTSVTISSGVTSISRGAFSGCTGLKSITIPNSVTSIGDAAFIECKSLTSVTIPNSVTSIGDGAFEDCGSLTSVTIPNSVTIIGDWAFSHCTGLTSVTIPSSVTSIGRWAFRRCTGLTSVTIPSSITSIEGGTFWGCTGLTSVTIPSSVTRIGGVYSDDGEWYHSSPAFTGCTALTRMVSLGNAPGMVSGEFAGAAPGFTIYYLSSRSGFTSPTWRGYPAIMIDETTYPAAGWLLEHGLWYDTDLHTDSDGDGVDLLMAYALDLDPRQNLQASLPVPVLSGNTLSLTFRATAPGVIYRAETSTRLTHWTTAGVTQSAPGPDGRSTAFIPLESPHRFLRLTVED